MPDLGMPEVLGLGLVAALTAYALLAGADFGGGVWDLLARGPRRPQQRELIAHAIGPIWEANHVWLILAVVLLFTCFPPAFTRLTVRLHIPLTLMLIGIVLRGSAFTFRSYDSQRDAVQRRWGRVFAIASTVSPILLGMIVGAIASGAAGGPVAGGFVEVFVAPWLSLFGFAVGLMALALFAFLAAVYLTVEAHDAELREDFRRRAIGAGVAVFLAAAAALLLAHPSAPMVRRGLLGSGWAIPFHLATAVAALTAFAALWTRRFKLARIAAAAQVSLIIWGWAAAQFPYIVPPGLTLDQAAAPAVTLRLTLYGLAGGSLILAPSLWYLFRVFKGEGSAFREVKSKVEGQHSKV
jgi:cytochrome d ubiquinol oxidase subunit II